jgi:methylase of polypeptide subunit release factors
MTLSYDAIAADYAIHRSAHPGVLRWLIEFCDRRSLSSVLEIGCGTGNYVISLAAATSARCSGL